MIARIVAPLIVLAALLVPAAPADAKTTAQRFADAFERAKSSVAARDAGFRTALDAIEPARCVAVVRSGSWPETAAEDARFLFQAAEGTALVVPATPVLDRLMADLDAIPTRDPRLRGARAVWRRIQRLAAAWTPFEQGCAKLEAWAESGWRPEQRPAVPAGNALELLEALEAGPPDQRLRVAARRLRLLGVSKGDAVRVTGATLFGRPTARLVDRLTSASDDDGT